MNKKIELVEKQVELAKVKAAKMDLELTILKKHDEIDRVHRNILVQDGRITELEQIISNLEQSNSEV
jgi:hypothetical protein